MFWGLLFANSSTWRMESELPATRLPSLLLMRAKKLDKRTLCAAALIESWPTNARREMAKYEDGRGAALRAASLCSPPACLILETVADGSRVAYVGRNTSRINEITTRM